MLDHIKAHRAEVRNRVRSVYAPSERPHVEKVDGDPQNSLEKGKKVPVGTVSNGYKKVAEGKWQKVSKHGMTKKEHDDAHSQLHPKEKKEIRPGVDLGKSFEKMKANSHPLNAKVDKFLDGFKDDATKWSEATGELADMHKTLAEYVNELGGDHKMREGYSKSPADHNQYHKSNIRILLNKLTPHQKDDFENHYKEWFNKGEEVGEFISPLDYQNIQKAQIAETFQKGGKPAVLGERREYGGKSYIKTANGWRPVGKNSGKMKDAHDAIHGKKSSFEQVLASPEGKQIVEGIEGLDSKRADHKPLYKIIKNN